MPKESFVLVVTEPEVEGKTRIIESILEKLVIRADLVTVPHDNQSPTVRNWCGGKDIPYSVVEEDEDFGFIEMCNFGVFFVSGPTRRAFVDAYRQALHLEGKIAFVIEVNSESES